MYRFFRMLVYCIILVVPVVDSMLFRKIEFVV